MPTLVSANQIQSVSKCFMVILTTLNASDRNKKGYVSGISSGKAESHACTVHYESTFVENESGDNISSTTKHI